MLNGTKEDFYGFLVHTYSDPKKNRLYLLGRLSDGKSFAAVEENWRPYFHFPDCSRSLIIQKFKGFDFEEINPMESFCGREKLLCLKFANYNECLRAAAILDENQIKSPDAGIKPAELYLTEKQISGYLHIRGIAQKGRRVDVVIRNPQIKSAAQNNHASAADQAGKFLQIPLCLASVDIETDVRTGVIRAAGLTWTNTAGNKISDNNINGKARVLCSGNSPQYSESVIFHSDEKELLNAFLEDIRSIDPDILTGWNFLDFDFPHLAQRFEKLKIPFTIGRSKDSAKYFPGDDGAGRTGRQSGFWRRRSAAAIVPGRQVLDALRIMRAGTQNRAAGQGFSLDEVALQVLGEGKIIHETGDKKIEALDHLYSENPCKFGEYCLKDSLLVLKILEKTGLYRLTMERACLTGVTLDKAWTSVASFERIYAIELKKRGIVPAVQNIKSITGASGGTVLDPESGLFNNVAVFDFRSLYPTIMRTFNIDPLSHARAEGIKPGNTIIAPNGAVFSREPGLLPALIAEYFSTRSIAIEKGDLIAAKVYKILMNSFYGVLGTSACRYGKSSLAGAITSFARKWLLFSRDWFNSHNLRVLYGDTDSLFVETGFGDISLKIFESNCIELTEKINLLISNTIKKEYNLESFIELRFEKAYRRFLIPQLRNFHASVDSAGNRGRAKGYGGYLLHHDGSLTVEVTGMEAVRSDTTPLARRLQLELLELVFTGCCENEYREKVEKTIFQLQSGLLDHELVYRKRLSRFPETYTLSTPPQVKVARALGWEKRRGTVEYLWTVNGPEPVLLPHGKPDYDHYIESQVFPLARSIAVAAHLDTNVFVTRKGSGQMQMELF